MQSSILWSTGIGDGLAPYTDAQLFAWLLRTLARSITTEGVHAGYTNELAVTGAVSPVSINTGAALVYGIPYENTAAVTVAVPTPGVGTTGHRVVLRASWAAQTVRVALVSSADGVATIPAVTQTPGVTYEITLATLTITTGGVITVTDARSYLHYTTRVSTAMLDDLAVSTAQLAALGVTTAKLALDSVDDTIVGNRVPALTRREGGSATDWSVGGTTDYTPGAVRMQAGAIDMTIGIGNYGVAATITYPVAFSQPPLILATARDLNTGLAGLPSATAAIIVDGASPNAQALITASRPVNQSTAATWLVGVNWVAIGQE